MTPLRELMRQQRIDKVPRGWYQAKAFAQREGYSAFDGKFYAALRFGIEEGFVKCCKFVVRTCNGAKALPHYRRVK